MILGVTPEQDELRASVRKFLADRAPLSAVRQLMVSADGLDRGVWQQAGEQLGLQGIAIPEEYGGAGFSFAEQAIVLEELGAALYTGPYLASAVLAATALLASDDEKAKASYLPGIASGELIATLAFTEEDGSWDPAAIRVSASPAGSAGEGSVGHGSVVGEGSVGDGSVVGEGSVADGRLADGSWRLNGSKSFVLDGHAAGLILVAARTGADGELSLFAVHAEAVGLTRTALPTLDQTRKLARLDFDATPAALVGEAGAGARILGQALDVAAIAQAAEQLGGAQRVLDMAVAYAKVRQQFGRPIGSFQAIKHMCADLLAEVESLRSAVQYAAAAVAESSSEVPVLASLVKAYASDVFSHAAAENIQIHGGIGFTWEHDAHLYFKRAKASELFLGSPSYHRERLASRIGL